MAELQIRVEMAADHEMPTTYVMCDVFSADPKAPQELRQKLRNLEIPAGDNPDRWETISLPPGNYEVQVSLPSGQLLAEGVHVEPGEAPAQLIMHTNSPHEWLSIQHLQGNIGSRSRYRPEGDWMTQAHTRGGGSPRSWAMKKGRPLARGRAILSRGPDGVFWCTDSAAGGSNPEIWQIFAEIQSGNYAPPEATERFFAAFGVKAPLQNVNPYRYDAQSSVYRFISSGAVGSTSGESGNQKTRHYVLVSDSETVRVLSAPVPWYELDGSGDELAFEVLTSVQADIVTNAIRDPRLGSMIGYLTNNAPEKARSFVDRAHDMLFDKVSNPLAAVAGAYVLLSTELKTGPAHWHEWVKNLHSWFEWIPDGAIAYATMKLNHQQSDEDIDEALDALLEAKRRGIPYFSLGMRWLLDGLTSFVYDERYESRRDEIKAALAEVRALATRTNYQQPFTGIEVSRRV